MAFVYFIAMVGVLVFVHELGHFLWAKAFGVRVLRFSLGFGPRVAGFHHRGTEYVISALPLGGYVRLLGENPRDEIRREERARSISAQPILRRVMITVAGPLMSLVFPVLLYFIVFLGDSQLVPSTVGMVFENRPAAGKLEPGDRVVAIDGEPVATFYDLTRIVERAPGRALRFTVEREGKQLEQTIVPVADTRELPLQVRKRVGRIGVAPHHPLAAVGVEKPVSAATAAGLRSFDVVVSAGGHAVESWRDLEQALGNNQGTLVPLSYLRPTPVPRALGGLVELEVYEPRIATFTPDAGSGRAITRSGLEPAELYVSKVDRGSPEERAGLLPGDRLLELDGQPIRTWAGFEDTLRVGKGATHELRWRRGQQPHSAQLALAHEHGVNEHGQGYDHYLIGVHNWLPTRIDAPIANPAPVSYAVREAVHATLEVIELTLVSMLRLVQGKLSIKSLGGPLTIFDVAGTAARRGALNYLTLMAFISINLGLINLLPIPLLDGGYLLFLFYEAIVRRPLSPKVRDYAHIAGLLMLLAIMILAFKNDIERQWPQIVDELTAQ